MYGLSLATNNLMAAISWLMSSMAVSLWSACTHSSCYFFDWSAVEMLRVVVLYAAVFEAVVAACEIKQVSDTLVFIIIIIIIILLLDVHNRTSLC